MKLPKINTFYLKIIALLFMLCDHIAYVFIPTTLPVYMVMRCIGRLAAPLFWFSFTEGYKHTSDKRKYLMRLFIAGMIMGAVNTLIGFAFNFNVSFFSPNMFMSFALMICIIDMIEVIMKETNLAKMFLFTAFIVFGATVIWNHAEYGPYMLFIVPMFYFLKNHHLKIGLYVLISFVICLIKMNVFQMWMIAAAIFLFLYTSEKPKQSLKWFFYIFYPLHLWIFFILKYLFL